MKKGFIFSFDSFLALIMFTLFTLLIYIFFIFAIPTTQQYYFAEDLINVLNGVRISELDLNAYSTISTMINDKKITDTSLTILQQIITFKEQGDSTSACQVFKDIAKDKIKPSASYGIGLDLGSRSSDICVEVLDPKINIITRSRTSIGKVNI